MLATPSRIPRIVLASVLGALLLAGLALLATGCSDSVAAAGIGTSSQTTDALAVLPSDADVYGMTNLAEARGSDALATALGGSGLGMVSERGSADFQDFVRMTGFDLAEDLDRMYVAVSDGMDERAAFVAYGRFDRERIERYLADSDEADFEVTQIEGTAVYLTTSEDGRRGGFALASDQMVLAGDEATLTGMVQRLGTTARPAGPDLQALFDRVAFPDDAWFVARGLDRVTGEIPAEAGPSALAARAAAGFVLSMRFDDDGVPVRAFLATKPEANPDDVGDVVRAGLSAMRIGMKDEPSALDVLDGVDVTAEAEGVRVEGFLTPAFLASAQR